MAEEKDVRVDDRFKCSTHYKYWLFDSFDTIQKLREIRIDESMDKIKKLENAGELPMLTYAEYCDILLFWQSKMMQDIFARYPNVPPYVVGTALTYLKRYYLSHSNMIETDAGAMSMTCIFLASKTEQAGIVVKDVAELSKIPEERIVSAEILLLNGLKFHLKVWNPFRPLRCFILDFHNVYKKMDEKKNELNGLFLNQIQEQTTHSLKQSYLSDICLVYAPSKIALAALMLILGNVHINGIKLKVDFKIKHYEREMKRLKAKIDDINEKKQAAEAAAANEKDDNKVKSEKKEEPDDSDEVIAKCENEMNRLQQNIDNLNKLFTNEYLINTKNLLRERSFKWFEKRFGPKPKATGDERVKKLETYRKIKSACQNIQKDMIETITKCQNFEKFTKKLKKPLKKLQKLQTIWFENEFYLKDKISPSPDANENENKEDTEESPDATANEDEGVTTTTSEEEGNKNSVLGVRSAHKSRVYDGDDFDQPPHKRQRLNHSKQRP